MTMSIAAPAARANRWSQLWLGVVCMVLIANLQYGWTLFVNPMHNARGWSLGDIQLAFAIFIATETWLTPFAGWAVDYLGPRRGPPIMIAFGAVLVAFAWVLNAYAMSLTALYIGAAISGTGAGAIYATCVGNAVKWFPDRRGLAVGLTAGGFGAGAALTVIPIRMMIEGLGYADTFFWLGIGQGAILLLIAPVMRAPMAGEIPATAAQHLARGRALGGLQHLGRSRCRNFSCHGRAHDGRDQQQDGALAEAEPEEDVGVAQPIDHHADRDDRERGASAEAARRQADREAAPVGKPLHRVAHTGRIDRTGASARNRRADVERGERHRVGIEHPSERDQNGPDGNHERWAAAWTKIVDGPTSERGQPGFRRDENREGELDVTQTPAARVVHRVDEQRPAVLKVGDQDHADDAKPQL